MKSAVLVLVAGCYAPTVAENVPCGPRGECPSNQDCYAGTCRSTPPNIDAPLADVVPDARPDAAFTCAGVDSVLNSPCVETFSGQGLYFDLEAKVTVGITGFSTMSQNPGARTMAIYYRPGSHAGFENNPAGWTLAGMTNSYTPASGVACPIEPTLVPTSFCIEIPQGQRVGFYLTMASGTGSIESFNRPTGEAIAETAQLKLYAGRLQQGVGTFTGTIVESKGFQGVVHTSL